MSGRVVAIVQARTGSSRLPNKVLAPLEGRPMLQFMLERVALARSLDAIAVATTNAARDDAIAEVAEATGLLAVRGSEADVLGRFVLAAADADADVIVRLTADCPLIAPEVIDRVVREYAAAAPVDLATNAPPTGRTYPDGMDVEVFSRAGLHALDAAADDPADREHVTRRFHRPPFRVHEVHLPEGLGHVRITVDDPDDLARVRSVASRLAAESRAGFTLDEVLRALRGIDRQPA